MAHQNEVKTLNLNSTKQAVQPVYIPVLFIKKGERFGAKHMRSTSEINSSSSHVELKSVPHYNLHQYPEGNVNPSNPSNPTRRPTIPKAPNSARHGSPRHRGSSTGEPLTERYPLFEAATTPRAKLLSSQHHGRTSIFNMKTPKSQSDARKSIKPNSIEASPTGSSIKNTFVRPSYLNFVSKMDPTGKSPRNNPLDIIGKISFKESYEMRRNELSSAGASPINIKCWEGDKIYEAPVVKDELYHKLRNNSIYSASGSRRELNKVCVPLSVFTPQTTKIRKSIKIKPEISAFPSTFITPRASMSSKGASNFTQAINGMVQPITLNGTRIYSSRPNFRGMSIKKAIGK